jgi:hypothetical protein
MTEFPITFVSTSSLRLERLMILARHDSGAINLATFEVIREIETEISWAEHRAAVMSAARIERMGCRP